jgi:hypothetical protein
MKHQENMGSVKFKHVIGHHNSTHLATCHTKKVKFNKHNEKWKRPNWSIKNQTTEMCLTFSINSKQVHHGKRLKIPRKTHK